MTFGHFMTKIRTSGTFAWCFLFPNTLLGTLGTTCRNGQDAAALKVPHNVIKHHACLMWCAFVLERLKRQMSILGLLQFIARIFRWLDLFRLYFIIWLIGIWMWTRREEYVRIVAIRAFCGFCLPYHRKKAWVYVCISVYHFYRTVFMKLFTLIKSEVLVTILYGTKIRTWTQNHKRKKNLRLK